MTNRKDIYRRKFESEEIFLHPLYNDSKTSYDLALIKLKEKVKMNLKINTACLSNESFTGNEKFECFFSGYGSITNSSNSIIL